MFVKKQEFLVKTLDKGPCHRVQNKSPGIYLRRIYSPQNL